jgi:hypothetical protein
MNPFVYDTSPQEAKEAIAELIYEVGVSVWMCYETNQSSAMSDALVDALPKYFGYNSGIFHLDRNRYSSAEWFAAIRDQLVVNQPVLYRIAGHLMVCDGWKVDEAGMQVHLNYGWGAGDNYIVWKSIDGIDDAPDEHFILCGITPKSWAVATVPRGSDYGAWLDADCDGDEDLLTTGYDYSQSCHTVWLETNNGVAGFGTTVAYCSTSYEATAIIGGDYNNDGAPDVLLCGPRPVLLRNSGVGVFSEDTEALPSEALDLYRGAFVDCDRDGRLDIVGLRACHEITD